MEEKETPNKPTYEQLEKMLMQKHQQLIMVENRLRSIDFIATRLAWLFKVIENKDSFSEEFVSKASKEIEAFLTLEEVTPEAEKD